MADYDLVIIGAGAAGLCAAIEAAGEGARPLVVEAFPAFGGAAVTSGGGCCIVGTPLQAARGVADNVDLATKDWLAFGGETADAEWARFYLERSRDELFVWLQNLGVVWDDLRMQEGNSVPRWHHPQGGGGAMMAALFARAQQLQVAWRFASPAARLLPGQPGRRVTGVEVESGGQRVAISAGAVIVASGGFANSPELLRQHVPDPGPGSRLLCGGALQAQGKGHSLLAEAGAHFVHLDKVWLYPYGTPDYLDPTGTRGIAVRGVEGEIWVNAQGRRFHNEALRGGKTGTQAVWAQTPRTCWSIFDRQIAQGLKLEDPQYRSQDAAIRERVEEFMDRSPFAHQADSFAALARAAGMPEAAFVATVEKWNAALRQGLASDPEFGRPLKGLLPVVEPPFYAMQYFPMARKNFGGVKTDLAGRVLRSDGTVIPGLYAAGEVAGMAGGHINGAAGLEGTMLGPSLFSGRVAGRAAAADLQAPA